ncbi:hypothetical protein GA0115252_132720 [Streptomyces sp. DfronAA-171]|nr:hypothetical protein GA0115252_132720 [Streptomyces sp. DfronAA-171]
MSSAARRRDHSSSTGSALTSARCTTVPAMTSKMRSALRAAETGSGSRGSLAAVLGAAAAEQDEAFLAVDDGGADAVPQRLVARRLGDDGHERGTGLGALQEPREAQHDGRDIPREASAVREFEFVEEHGDRVHDEFVLARPAPVERRLRDTRARGDVPELQPRPARLDEHLARRREDRGIGRGAAGPSRAMPVGRCRGGCRGGRGQVGGGHGVTIPASSTAGCERDHRARDALRSYATTRSEKLPAPRGGFERQPHPGWGPRGTRAAPAAPRGAHTPYE